MDPASKAAQKAAKIKRQRELRIAEEQKRLVETEQKQQHLKQLKAQAQSKMKNNVATTKVKRQIFDAAQPILSLHTSILGEQDTNLDDKAKAKPSAAQQEEQINKQKFLDSAQYTLQSVLKLECIYGSDFVIPGGLNKTIQFIDNLDISSNKNRINILDFGCGIGGSVFYMIQKYSNNINKIDAYNFSANMNKIAIKRYNNKMKQNNNLYANKINFLLCSDPTKIIIDNNDYNKYDIIYSRDILLHVYDKNILFNNFSKWLKPGGKIFITDYCLSSTNTQSKSLINYINTYKYKLHSINDYSSFLANNGFINIKSVDNTNEFINILNTELNNFQLNNNKTIFLNKFSENDYNEFIESWNGKLKRCLDGDQKWGIFSANKAGNASKTFLDNHQYTLSSILRYEKIFGNNFISTGGVNTTITYCNKLNLKPNQYVLDVGCGIGGSAFYMAHQYNVKVLGVDLSTNMINIANKKLKNDVANQDILNNVKFELCDITQQDYDENTFDVIYSRDTILHIYYKSELFKSFYKWLKPGGVLFITDYCCGKKPFSAMFNTYLKDRKYHLVTPNEYTLKIQNSGFINVDGKDETNQFINILNDELNKFELIKQDFISEFSLNDYNYIVSGWKSKVVRCNNGDQKWGSFIGYKPNNNDNNDDYKEKQLQSASKEFLDNHQYTMNSVLRYERIFGNNFISTGGITTTTKFVKLLNLKPNQYVLDVGCGIGGSAFYMVREYAVNVLGIDLSQNMLDIADLRLKKQILPSNLDCKFELCDVTKKQFNDNTFDVIYSRDTILHIFDKSELFKSFFKWLKPGGVLFITDYCCGNKPFSSQFNEYLKDRKYHLKTPNEYTLTIKNAGFINVDGKDETDQFINVLNDELDKFELIKQDFVNEFSLKDYDYIVKGWKSKIVRCNSGDQKWGSFIGYKPN